MKRLLPVLIYAVFLFILSHLPGSQVPHLFWDKLEHLAAYLLFGLLWARILPHRPLLIAFLGTTLYGLFDEIHQFFIVGREASGADLMMDSLGGLIGGWLYWRYQIWRSSHTTGFHLK